MASLGASVYNPDDDLTHTRSIRMTVTDGVAKPDGARGFGKEFDAQHRERRH